MLLLCAEHICIISSAQLRFDRTLCAIFKVNLFRQTNFDCAPKYANIFARPSAILAFQFAFDWHFICRNIEALIMKFHAICIHASNALTHIFKRIVAAIAGESSRVESPGNRVLGNLGYGRNERGAVLKMKAFGIRLLNKILCK